MKKGGFVIYGEGLGHGVGLCQMGAFALAKRGWSYKKILAHYFPGHVLKKMY
jgi:stage II sporulation protein D